MSPRYKNVSQSLVLTKIEAQDQTNTRGPTHHSPLHHAIKLEHRNFGWAYFQTQCSSKLISPQRDPTLAKKQPCRFWD